MQGATRLGLSGILAATLAAQRTAQGAGTTEDLLEATAAPELAEAQRNDARPAFGAAQQDRIPSADGMEPGYVFGQAFKIIDQVGFGAAHVTVSRPVLRFA